MARIDAAIDEADPRADRSGRRGVRREVSCQGATAGHAPPAAPPPSAPFLHRDRRGCSRTSPSGSSLRRTLEPATRAHAFGRLQHGDPDGELRELLRARDLEFAPASASRSASSVMSMATTSARTTSSPRLSRSSSARCSSSSCSTRSARAADAQRAVDARATGRGAHRGSGHLGTPGTGTAGQLAPAAGAAPRAATSSPPIIVKPCAFAVTEENDLARRIIQHETMTDPHGGNR